MWSSTLANHVKNGANERIACVQHQAASRFNEARSRIRFPTVVLGLMIGLFSYPLRSQTTAEASKPVEWKSVSFAIVRFNDEAPASWNIYHTSKRGVLLALAQLP